MDSEYDCKNLDSVDANGSVENVFYNIKRSLQKAIFRASSKKNCDKVLEIFEQRLDLAESQISQSDKRQYVVDFMDLQDTLSEYVSGRNGFKNLLTSINQLGRKTTKFIDQFQDKLTNVFRNKF